MKKAMAACAAFMALAGAASAHHSFALFDMSKIESVSGTVAEIQWANPHCWVDLMVPDDTGAMVKWRFEGASPNVLVRMGWTKETLKLGDQVTVSTFPFRDGTIGGALRAITLPDGRELPAYNYPRADPGQ
jgi:Family of unknown function (DUF6152)